MKYEYVVYIKDVETPEEVAAQEGTLTADQAVTILHDLQSIQINVGIVRREKGAMLWQPIPEAL